jgi:two-component system OmpR family response regulator
MGINALIVDDEEEIGQILQIILNKEGINVDVASDLSKAQVLLERNNYQVVFLDLNLPDGTGFDLIEKINEGPSGINVVILSAFDGWIEKNKARDLGVNMFIGKPFSKHEILESLTELNLT